MACAPLRIAFVHDWLTGMRGGERVLHELAALHPEADLYTLIHVPGTTSERIEGLRIHASPLSRLPGVARHYRKLLPLFPRAIEQLRVEPCDLVVSISHAVAKGVRAPRGAAHLCYCLTPMRYVWDQADVYLGRGVRRALAAPLVAQLRRWDRRTSTAQRVTRFVAISQTVASRIRRHYGREAAVVHPPVDLERFRPSDASPGDHYLMVGGFVPYKREWIALEAFRALGAPLVVVGDGPGRERLARGAAANIRFTGTVSDAELAELYARCRALVYTSEEDFGLVPLEAQACGRPVIAWGRGGATETVVPLDGAAPPTGVFFETPTADALVAAVRRFESNEGRFDPRCIRAHAERFSVARFRRELNLEMQAARVGS